MFGRRCLAVCLVPVVLAASSAARGEVTKEQRQEISAIKSAIRKAENLAKQKKFGEAGRVLRHVHERLAKAVASGDTELLKLARPAFDDLAEVQPVLELAGIELPPVVKPEAPDPGGTAFTKQVAPILVNKCGRCHVNRASGMLSMASYGALLAGTPDNKNIVVPKDPVGSRLIEAIESGDMPRGGLKVAPEELETLKKWIGEGAAFDGDDPQLPLSRIVGRDQPAAPAAPEVRRAMGSETVSFARDVAGVLASTCGDCHGGGQQTQANFNLTNLQRLLQGGDNGPPVVPGQPNDSLLIQKLKGTAAGDRMPRGRPPLADDVIARIATWVAEGALLDGDSATQPLAEMAAVARARSATHDELSADRLTLADRHWKLGLPEIQIVRAETKNFLLIGGRGEATLKTYGPQAELVAERLGKMFKLPAGEPLVKGRITLFFLDRRYDYSEFGKMVEQRDLPPDADGHWRYSVVDAYAALVVPPTDSLPLDGPLAHQLGAIYVASLGQPPRWFAEGSGRVAASRLAPDDARVRRWNDGLPRVLTSLQRPDDFLQGKLPIEQADIASYSFVKFLMSDSKRYDKLLNLLRQNQDFGSAFAQAYGAAPEPLTAAWAARASQEAAPSSRRRKSGP